MENVHDNDHNHHFIITVTEIIIIIVIIMIRISFSSSSNHCLIRSRLDGEVLKSEFVAKMRPRSLVNHHVDDGVVDVGDDNGGVDDVLDYDFNDDEEEKEGDHF